MQRADLLNSAILSLPTNGLAKKREFCLAGHLADLLRGIVLAGKEKKFFAVCGTRENLNHLFAVLISCTNACLYDNAVYQVALAAVWFFCKNEVQTKAMLFAASDRDPVEWVGCFCGIIQIGASRVKDSVKFTCCLSDALLVMNFMFSMASSADVLRFAKVIYEKEVLPLVFSVLFVRGEDEVYEAICRMTALFVQMLGFVCSQEYARESPASKICDTFLFDHKVFEVVADWLCKYVSQHVDGVTIVSCFILLTSTFLLGPEVDAKLRELVRLKVMLIVAENPTNSMINEFEVR
jgi:hypothetical protein